MFRAPEKVAKRLMPRRDIPGTASPPSRRRARNAIAKAKEQFETSSHGATVFEAGLSAGVLPELQPLREAVHTLLCGLDLASILAAELETLAGALVVLSRLQVKSLLPVIAYERGLADAVEVAFHTRRFGLASNGSWMEAVFLVDERPRQVSVRIDSLRHVVCAADDGTYTAALERAEQLRAGAPVERRWCLSYLFPDAAWVDDDIRALRSGGVSVNTWRDLIADADDLVLVREIVAGSGSAAQPAWQRLPDAALTLARRFPPEEVVPLLAEALEPLLVKPRHGPLLKTPPRRIVEALGCIVHPLSAEVLAVYAGHRFLGAQVAIFFQDNPQFLPILEAGASGKAGRALVEALQGPSAAESSESAETPPILRDRPWRVRPNRRADGVLALSMPAELSERVNRDGLTWAPPFPPLDAKRLARWRKKVAQDEAVGVDGFVASEGYGSPPVAEALAVWNSGKGYVQDIESWVAQVGIAGLPGMLKRKWWTFLRYEGGSDWVEAAFALVSPRMAPAMAHVAVRSKALRRRAHAWLVDHAVEATVGLVPTALGADRAARQEAAEGLWVMGQLGASSSLRETTAETYGREARVRVDAILARNPLELGKKPPKAPDFLRADRLPPLEMRAGGVLAPDGVDALLEMLRSVPVAPPYAGCGDVASAVVPESLDSWLVALFEQWVVAGGGGRHDWIAWAHTRFAAPRAARRAAEQLRTWGSKSKANAERLAEILAVDGSDQALLQLAHVGHATRFAALRARIAELLSDIARERGLTEDDLADRTVPSLGLGADGTTAVSFGPRTYTLSLDTTLEIVIRDGAGTVVPRLPRGAKTDDPALAAQAKRTYKALKKDVEAIRARLVTRLERAMSAERTWTVASFRSFVADHPVVRQVARGLVWRVIDGAAFRIAEDGSFADVEDDARTLPSEGRIALAHPATLSDIARWGELFGDYEIVQPFEQLGRSTAAPTEAERTQRELRRHVGWRIGGGALMGTLESRGWIRERSSIVSYWTRSLGEVEARLCCTPGVDMSHVSASGEQTLKACEVSVPLGRLSPVAFSELVRDLDALSRDL